MNALVCWFMPQFAAEQSSAAAPQRMSGGSGCSRLAFPSFHPLLTPLRFDTLDAFLMLLPRVPRFLVHHTSGKLQITIAPNNPLYLFGAFDFRENIHQISLEQLHARIFGIQLKQPLSH